jgi:hypothetical protein
MSRFIAILLLFIITGQTVQPAFAGNCCAADAELNGELLMEADKAHSCCTAPAPSSEQPAEDESHECPDDCECSCCTHVVFDLPRFPDFNTSESQLPELNIGYPTYFFQISFPVFQPPQLG